MIVDVTGYFPATCGFTPITNPQRVLDTRSGVGAAAFGGHDSFDCPQLQEPFRTF